MDHNVINQAVAELREDINKVKLKIGDTVFLLLLRNKEIRRRIST